MSRKNACRDADGVRVHDATHPSPGADKRKPSIGAVIGGVIMARHILIIDDNEYLLYLLRSVLEDERYQVSVIGRGEGASERIEENPPDAIILDLKLGEVSGLDVLESLRSHEATATIPVLIYTAAILEAETAAKLVAGNPARYRNVSVLRKPFDVDVLLARVGQLIEAS